MKTIVIANQKGGSGKSTITVHLAAAAEKAGDGPAVISDTDPQGTAADWFNQRKKAGIDTPRYSALSLSDLSGRIQDLSEAGASYLFIDTAPSIGAVNADLFALADLDPDPVEPDAGRPSRPGQRPSARPGVRQAVPVRADAGSGPICATTTAQLWRSMRSAWCCHADA